MKCYLIEFILKGVDGWNVHVYRWNSTMNEKCK
jgi:hypothetical protein